MSVTVTGDGPNIELTGTGSDITITVTTGSGGGGGVTDHGLLTGLGDDDHTQYAKKASNLSDLADAATARTNLGLGTAATQASSAFDAAGTASSLVTAHTSDTSDAHDASAISIGALNGNLSAVSGTDVEQALQAVDNLSLGGTVDVVSNVATNTILGRTTAGSGNSEELTASQVRTLLKTPQSSDDTVLDIRVMTQAAYDAITPSSTTIYFISG